MMAHAALLVAAASAIIEHVPEVNASTFDPDDYDAVVDVRNIDEYEGNTSAADCSIGAHDSKGCTYGHVPGAIWFPQLFLCGGVVPGTTCPQEEQLLADAHFLSGEIGKVGETLKDFPRRLDVCRPLRLAFICHSGVRSLVAADNYAALLQELYGEVPEGAVVSVAGGTQLWYRSGRHADFGPLPGGPRTCKQIWESAATSMMF